MLFGIYEQHVNCNGKGFVRTTTVNITDDILTVRRQIQFVYGNGVTPIDNLNDKSHKFVGGILTVQDCAE